MPESQSPRSRVRISLPDRIDREALLAAIARIDREGYVPHHDSHTYDVLHQGKTYPPIAVVAFAIERLTEQIIQPGQIRGGEGTQAFTILREAGFEIISRLPSEAAEEEYFEARVAALRKPSQHDRPAPEGNAKPTRSNRARSQKSYERDPEVHAWILDHAQGVCGLCGSKAPFISRSTGFPYLEVHHVLPLADDGPDTIDNTVALCPNCHRKCHFSSDSRKISKQLEKTIARLRSSSADNT